MGILNEDPGKLIETDPVYERALRAIEEILGPNHALMLNIVNNLGKLYVNLGLIDQVEQQRQQVPGRHEHTLHSNVTSVLGEEQLLQDSLPLDICDLCHLRSVLPSDVLPSLTSGSCLSDLSPVAKTSAEILMRYQLRQHTVASVPSRYRKGRV
jgi:hypothetical protein